MHRWTGGTTELADRGCYVCGGSDNLISTDVIIEQEGILALCTGCIVTAAKFGGYRLWSPEMEAELEDYRVRVRDAEVYRRIAEDAVINIAEAATRVEAQRATEAEAAAAKLAGRDSKGHYVKQSVPEGTSNA